MKNTLLVAIDSVYLADRMMSAFPEWHSIRVNTPDELVEVADVFHPDLIVSEWDFSPRYIGPTTKILEDLAKAHPQAVVLRCSQFNAPDVVDRWDDGGVLDISMEQGVTNLRHFYDLALARKAQTSLRASGRGWLAGLVLGGALLGALALRVSSRTKEVFWDLESLMELTPLEFERVIKERFEAEGYTAQLTKQSHDDGVDIIVTRDQPPEGLVVLLVQCKLYTERASVPSKDIRELRGTVAMEKGTKGILVSTVPLSVPALKKMRANAERVGAITGPDLIAWLNAKLKEPPIPAKS